MYPSDKDRVIRLLKEHVPSDEECKKARTALHDGKCYGVEDARAALKAAGLTTEPTMEKCK